MSISVSGASGSREAAVGARTPFEGMCLSEPSVVSGGKPDSPGLEEEPPKRIVEEDCVPDCKTCTLDVTLVTGKGTGYV